MDKKLPLSQNQQQKTNLKHEEKQTSLWQYGGDFFFP